ncbi:MAG TPA: sensor histidine kinase [Thermoanaerobaculia bacterium]|nr:sensor histidine kinase [Thermoanaerobaculia bacterium]
MDTLYSPQSRAERIIAAGRVVLATSSLFAVWLDPTEPAKYARVAYSLLVAYVVYSTVIALLTWRSDGPGPRQRLVTHAFDLAFFSLFVYFTAGPASPFMAYFVFSMVCATLRWQWRGVLWTAVASIAAYLAVAIYFSEALQGLGTETYRLVIRLVYLGVIAVLLGYLGAHEEQTRREISRLASWPQPVAQRLETAVRSLLEHAARVVGAPRVLLAWMEEEEPWLYLASWQEGELQWRRESPGAYEPLVAAAVAEGSFLCPKPGGSPVVLFRASSGLQRWHGLPLHPGLHAQLGTVPLLGVRLRSESCTGHLFFLGKPGMTSDDLLLGEVVGGLVASSLDYVHLTRSLQETAATEERIRLARDLHDGVLQSLAGMGLRLEAVRRLLTAGGAGAVERLEELQRLIALEQRDLRFFIQELKPRPLTAAGELSGLDLQLSELVQRLELEWGLQVDLEMDGLGEEVPEAPAREIYHIVRESLVNAARHGEASRVRVRIQSGQGRIAITVSDNGRGFPFEGRFSHADLALRNLGPRSLRERVSALHGTVSLDSSRSGARLDISLPLWGTG